MKTNIKIFHAPSVKLLKIEMVHFGGYRLDPVNSNSFVGHLFVRIKQIFNLNNLF